MASVYEPPLCGEAKAGPRAARFYAGCAASYQGVKGRIKRKQEEAEVVARAAQAAEPEPVCALCERPLGARVEWHHRIPKSEGGTEMVPVHPICHRTIHAHVSNHELATVYADLNALREREDMQRFLRWIEKKPENFNAPTRRKRAG